MRVNLPYSFRLTCNFRLPDFVGKRLGTFRGQQREKMNPRMGKPSHGSIQT